MKPLFAAAYTLSQRHTDQLVPFFQCVQEVVADDTERRFNVFMDRPTKPKRQRKDEGKNRGEATEPDETAKTEWFEIDAARLRARIKSLESGGNLWLVFGHQTNFGLLRWLVGRSEESRVSKQQLMDFSEEFVAAVGEHTSEHSGDEVNQLSARIGVLHRLCTVRGTQQVLERAILKLNPKPLYSAAAISALLRATIPLLHNEGYQDGRNPTGNAQSHFVKRARDKVDRGDLYWRVMGHAVAVRVLGQFVD
jgi:hypothetical protein